MLQEPTSPARLRRSTGHDNPLFPAPPTDITSFSPHRLMLDAVQSVSASDSGMCEREKPVAQIPRSGRRLQHDGSAPVATWPTTSRLLAAGTALHNGPTRKSLRLLSTVSHGAAGEMTRRSANAARSLAGRVRFLAHQQGAYAASPLLAKTSPRLVPAPRARSRSLGHAESSSKR